MTNETKTRDTLSDRHAKGLRMQIRSFAETDLGAYTCERVRSHFKDARSDLFIYDGNGKLAVLGREFGDRTPYYWLPIGQG